MNDAVSMFLMVGGGLGMFLLGMKHLSEGLQAVSGSGLRKFMSLATTHRLAGVGTGLVFTAVVQSSAATILNAYERVRAYYLNIAETLAGGK